MTKKSMFNSPELGKVVLAGLDWLDANAAECKRLKTETMDGYTLVKGLEVFYVNDPFYPAIVMDSSPEHNTCCIKCRKVNDRRKKYTDSVLDGELFCDAKRAFQAAIKIHDETSKKLTCNINDAEKIIEQRGRKRNELLNGWAKVLNEENPHGLQWPIETYKNPIGYSRVSI